MNESYVCDTQLTLRSPRMS